MSNRFRTSVALFAALAAAGPALAFPTVVELHNNHFRLAVEPETSAEVPAYSALKVTVRDADQLKRMVGNVEQLNGLGGYAEDVGLTVVVLDLPADDANQAALFSEPPASDSTPEAAPPAPEVTAPAPAPPVPAAPKGKRAT
jgi:hypothetical protein